MQQYPVQVAGSAKLNVERWVPAEELEAFNRHIVGLIEVAASYYGDCFEGD